MMGIPDTRVAELQQDPSAIVEEKNAHARDESRTSVHFGCGARRAIDHAMTDRDAVTKITPVAMT